MNMDNRGGFDAIGGGEIIGASLKIPFKIYVTIRTE